MLSWVGYYSYEKLSEMTFNSVSLDEQEGVFVAQGYDECGVFTFNGTIRNDEFKAIKHYPTWDIHYMGQYIKDPQEIKGFWGYAENEPLLPFKILRVNDNKKQEFQAYIQEYNVGLNQNQAS